MKSKEKKITNKNDLISAFQKIIPDKSIITDISNKIDLDGFSIEITYSEEDYKPKKEKPKKLKVTKSKSVKIKDSTPKSKKKIKKS
jgi:hypothetical protein